MGVHPSRVVYQTVETQLLSPHRTRVTRRFRRWREIRVIWLWFLWKILHKKQYTSYKKQIHAWFKHSEKTPTVENERNNKYTEFYRYRTIKVFHTIQIEMVVSINDDDNVSQMTSPMFFYLQMLEFSINIFHIYCWPSDHLDSLTQNFYITTSR